MLFLKCIKDFASLKWFGSLFHKSASLNSAGYSYSMVYQLKAKAVKNDVLKNWIN